MKILDCVHCYTLLYNNIFKETFNTICPLVTKKINGQENKKWYNQSLGLAKRGNRRMELEWRMNKTEENRRKYKESTKKNLTDYF